jgi:hypothetical protein
MRRLSRKFYTHICEIQAFRKSLSHPPMENSFALQDMLLDVVSKASRHVEKRGCSGASTWITIGSLAIYQEV